MSAGDIGRFIVGAVLVGAGLLTGQGWLVGLGISLSVGVVAAQLASRQDGIELNDTSTVSSLPVVYGKAKLGLRIVDLRVDPSSSDRELLYVVGALCHGSENGQGIQAIDEIYFDNRLAVAADGTEQSPWSTPANRLKKTKYLGTDAQTVDPDLTAAFPNKWPTSSKGAGVAYLVLALAYDKDVYATGIPNVTVLVRGQKVFDPRSSTTVYSTNPILALRDYLLSTRYGLGAAASELDDASFIAEANHCDELISVPPDNAAYKVITAATAASPIVITATAHGWNTGDQVNIRQDGATPPGLTGLLGTWTVTKINNDQVSLNGSSGSGSYNASSCSGGKLVTQKRFELNGWVDTGQAPEENVRQLLSACRGTLVYEGGKFKVFIKRSTIAQAFTLNEATILGGWQFSVAGIAESPNLGRARFIHAGKNYQPDDLQWPRPGGTNTYLTEDNGYESALDLELPFTSDRLTAEQLTMVAVREGRAGLSCSVLAVEEALVLAVGDVVPVTHPTPGWTNKLFWVMGIVLNPDATVRLALQQYDPNAYVLDPQAQFPALPQTDLPDPFTCAAPINVTLVSDGTTGLQQADGTWVQRIKVTWAKPGTDPFWDYLEVQAKKTADSLWDAYGRPAKEDTQFFVVPVQENVSWDVRLRAVNTLGIPSAWVTGSLTPGSPGSSPLIVGGLVANFHKGDLFVTWNPNTEDDHAGYEIREGGTDWATATPLGGGTKYFVQATGLAFLRQRVTKRSYTIRIKAENRLGLQGPEATVSASQLAPDPTAISGGDITVNSQTGMVLVEVDATASRASELRLYASLTNGFTPSDATRKDNTYGTISTARGLLQFPLPIAWLGQTVYLKIGLKDELTDVLAEAEVYTSQFTVTGGRVVMDDVADGSIFARIRGNALTGGVPTTGVADDFTTEFPGRRWKKLSGSGTADRQPVADAQFGGHVMRVVGDACYEWVDNIPFDPTLLYAVKWRLRQRKNPSSGLKDCFLGVAGIKADGVKRCNLDSHDNFFSQHYAAANGLQMTEGPTWTEVIGYVQGYAGSAFALTAGMLTNSGLGNFTATNAVDGTLTSKAWDTNAGVASGSYVQFDLGSAQTLVALRLYLNDVAPSTVKYKLQYADAAGGPYTDHPEFSGAKAWSPPLRKAWNELVFGTNGVTAHRYWRLVTVDAGAAGADVMDVQFITKGSPGGAHPDPNSPATMAYGTKYLRPIGFFNWNTGTDGEIEVDVMVMPLHAATMAAMLRDDQQRKFETYYLSDGVLKGGVLIDDGTSPLPFLKGEQRFAARHNVGVSFNPQFALPPSFDIRGGLNSEPRAKWGTVAQVNAGTAATARSSAVGEEDDVGLVDLTGSGGTVRALLRQRTGTPTSRTHNFASGNICDAVGETAEVTLSAGPPPSYNDQYQVRFRTHLEGEAKYSPVTATITIAVDVDDGSGWVQRGTAQHSFVYPLGAVDTDEVDHEVVVSHSGLGNGDKIRIRLVSYVESGLVKSSTWWAKGFDGTVGSPAPGVEYVTVADQWASKTPDNDNVLTVTVVGYI